MSNYGRELDRKMKGIESTGSELDRKYWMALALYVVLAALAWFTVGEGSAAKTAYNARAIRTRSNSEPVFSRPFISRSSCAP